jgi:hypothetical protein
VSRRRLSGSLPAIVVMQAAEDRVRHDSARLGQRLRLARDALLDALVWSCVIEVGDVFLDDAVKMALAEDEEVVKALSAETPQESLTDSVGLWRPDRRPQNLDVSPLSDPVEGCPVLAVIVTNEESRRFAQWSSIAELLSDPGVGRVGVTAKWTTRRDLSSMMMKTKMARNRAS